MTHITVAICVTGLLLFSYNNEKKINDLLDSANASEYSSFNKLKGKNRFAPDTTAPQFQTPGEFHKMLARSNGTWTGKGLFWFSPNAQPVVAGTSVLVNTMAMNGLYQISEIKGTPDMGKPWTGLRITGYDNERKLFTRAMIGDGTSAGGVGMEGPWDEATKSFSMPFTKPDQSGKNQNLKEVYRIIDQNTEILEIYNVDPETKKEFKILEVTWTRKK